MSSRRAAEFRTAILVGLCAAALSSCAAGAQRQGRSPGYLVIEQLVGASAAKPSEASNTLESDVRTKGSIFEDPGTVTVHLNLKNIGTALVPTSPTANNEITITRYHVSYTRSDGQSTQGVDVPYAFDGAVTATVTGDKASTFSFVLVRVQAKEEAPLGPLVAGGGQGVISTIATVTFYGQDQAGNDVSVSGTISVNFADWGDPS